MSEPAIPQSLALTEADPDSLSELFSRDPEFLSRSDRDRIRQVLLLQQKRYEMVEEAGKTVRPVKAGKPKLPLIASASPEDLGL